MVNGEKDLRLEAGDLGFWGWDLRLGMGVFGTLALCHFIL
ncbi:unnamed protein product, partial [marine sediment metagenome]